MEDLIDFVFVNSQHNYQFLKLQKKLNISSKGKFSFEDNLSQLGPTLGNFDFNQITGQA